MSIAAHRTLTSRQLAFGAGTVTNTAANTAADSTLRSHLRLTRRGRAVLVAIIATPLVVLALFFALNGGVAVAGLHGDNTGVSFEHVTVQPGQSLWQIAESIAPHDDPRDVVSAIVDLNQLQSSVVNPGESLAVPAEYTSGR